MSRDSVLEVTLKPSVALTIVLGVLHAAAAGSVWMVELPGVAKALLVTLLAASAVGSVRRHALLIGNAVCIGMRIAANGACELHLSSGQTQSGIISGNWFVSPILVVLNPRSESGRRVRNVVVMRDSADPETFRRLRVFLRYRLASD